MPSPVVASAAPTALWYLTRATGIVALVVLSTVVVLGVLTTRGWSSPRWPRFVSQAMHRNLSLFALVLIAVHIVTTVADGFAPIAFIDGVVPFHSPYRPLWLGLGGFSFDLLLVVAITSAVRHRLGYRTWRVVHWLAYASWPVAVLHGLGTGTDTPLAPVLLVDVVCVAAVLVAVSWRLIAGWPARAGARLAAGTAAWAFVLSAAAFTMAGPLRAGWAQRAGTPASLLARSPVAAATSGNSAGAAPGSAATTTTGGLSGPFSSPLTGALSTSAPDGSGQVTVDIRGHLNEAPALPFDISLVGTPDDGGVAMTSGRVSIGSSTGSVVGLEGDTIMATAGSPAGTLEISFRLTIDRASGAVTGTARGVVGR